MENVKIHLVQTVESMHIVKEVTTQASALATQVGLVIPTLMVALNYNATVLHTRL